MIHSLFKEIRGLSFSCASSSSVAINRHEQRQLKNSQRWVKSTSSSSSSNPELHQKHSRKSLHGEELTDIASPSTSSRYLLDPKKFLPSDTSFFLEPIPAYTEAEFSRSRCIGGDRASLARPKDQVVVLRVSLHCKGCEGKVRKHISRMEGVRSFSVDLATKKVTVMGDVTPLEVLSSITKVKKAHLIHPPPALPEGFQFAINRI